jgi:predicted RNA methylase
VFLEQRAAWICFVRVTLTPSCQDLRTAVRQVEVAGGNGRLQLGVGVRNDCAVVAADINVMLAIEGNVSQKGDVEVMVRELSSTATHVSSNVPIQPVART